MLCLGVVCARPPPPISYFVFRPLNRINQSCFVQLQLATTVLQIIRCSLFINPSHNFANLSRIRYSNTIASTTSITLSSYSMGTKVSKIPDSRFNHQHGTKGLDGSHVLYKCQGCVDRQQRSSRVGNPKGSTPAIPRGLFRPIALLPQPRPAAVAPRQGRFSRRKYPKDRNYHPGLPRVDIYQRSAP